MNTERIQLIIHGQVQGVGFRPHVYRIAKQLNLTGSVRNSSDGVFIEVQGNQANQFKDQLIDNLPPLAKIDHINITSLPISHFESNFEILQSDGGKTRTIISPDMSICNDCLDELLDNKSRYYHYPFLNCTNCGPRLTITHQLPYDRNHTTMENFTLCRDCEAAYLSPDNRRYHAQPSACAECGPKLSHSINTIADAIRDGKIIALKGLGGYQLICDAYNESAVLRLRRNKNRPSKPFALMLYDAECARQIANISDIDESQLISTTRPIVLLEKKNHTLPDSIAPGLSHYGIVLPYTPIHYLLFNAINRKHTNKHIGPTALVFTSANIGGNPLIIDDQYANKALGEIADLVVSYNRDIVTRVDDSVIRIIDRAPVFIRRARGYVPKPIKLPHTIPSTLALGGHLKNTFCITRDDEAFISQHIGDLNNRETIEFFHESLDHLLSFLDVQPERIAHDLHPNFYTTQLASCYNASIHAVQHHHAHLASVVAELHITEPVLGLALDGHGYGPNGDSWGGELLFLNGIHFQRLGHLMPLPLPGGDIAITEPWRMAASVLHHLNKTAEINKRFSKHPQSNYIHHLLDKKINCPLTSSAGRLFDAASAILGVQTISQYESQAPMLLESLVTQAAVYMHGWHINDNYLDMTPLFAALLDIEDPVIGANLFHGTLIAALSDWIMRIARKVEIDTVLLSGGCFLNKVLTEGLTTSLRKTGIRPLLPRELPPNDGGIALGQAWIGGRQ